MSRRGGTVSDSDSHDPDAIPLLVTFPSVDDYSGTSGVQTTTSSITAPIKASGSLAFSLPPRGSLALRKLALGAWVFFGIFLLGCWFFTYQGAILKKLAPFALRGNHKRPPNPQGPWHECLWMSGQQCSHFIESQVPSYIKIDFMHKDEVNSVKDFHPNRVIIWLDANEQVIEVPTRG